MKQELYSIDSQKWDMLLELLEHPESIPKPKRQNFWAMRK